MIQHIIMGLGNPGSAYAHTRHNVGWMVLDAFTSKNPDVWKWKSKKNYSSALHNGILLVKPETFMNDSGNAWQALTTTIPDLTSHMLMLIHDDADIPFGSLKLQFNRSHAGHKGVKSLCEQCGSCEFYRLRIGIATPLMRVTIPTDEFVLKKFSAEEKQVLKTDIMPHACELIEKHLQKN